jgi:oxidoreductase
MANKDSKLLYLKTKGETEHAIEEAGFEKVSIFRPGFLELVEERTRPRLGEKIMFNMFKPIDQLFGLGMVINVGSIGKAMHKVAEDASLTAKERSTASVGSSVSIFTHYETKDIAEDLK